jgi:hypothetical protein
MLSWRISRSVKVNALSGTGPMLLYTWLIPHCDNLGRFHGEPGEVRWHVFPKLAVTDSEVESWLRELDSAGLIEWYTVDGLKYLRIPPTVWGREQKLRGNMSTVSDFPDPVRTACEHRANGVDTPYPPEGEGEGEVEGEEEEEVEGEGGSATPRDPAPASGHEAESVRKRTWHVNGQELEHGQAVTLIDGRRATFCEAGNFTALVLVPEGNRLAQVRVKHSEIQP